MRRLVQALLRWWREWEQRALDRSYQPLIGRPVGCNRARERWDRHA
jgi:hypothetical protein